MPKTPEQLERQRQRAAARKAARAGKAPPPTGTPSRQPRGTTEPLPADQRIDFLPHRVPHPESATASKRYALDMIEELEILIDQKPNWLPGDNYDLAAINYCLVRALKHADKILARHTDPTSTPDDSKWRDRRKRNYWRPPIALL